MSAGGAQRGATIASPPVRQVQGMGSADSKAVERGAQDVRAEASESAYGFSSRWLASRAGSVWRRAGPLGVF